MMKYGLTLAAIFIAAAIFIVAVTLLIIAIKQ